MEKPQGEDVSENNVVGGHERSGCAYVPQLTQGSDAETQTEGPGGETQLFTKGVCKVCVQVERKVDQEGSQADCRSGFC